MNRNYQELNRNYPEIIIHEKFMTNSWQFMLVLIAVCLFATSVGVWAQKSDTTKINTLSLGVNHLTHGEIMRGGLPVNDNEITDERSNFLLGRTRLTVDFNRPGLEAYAVLQNKTVWGSADNQTLGLYEGWVKMTARNGLFAQVGRVALSYDDERIIGTNDFAMASLSHDVLRVGYEGHGHQVHAILAYNQNVENVYKTTYYDNGAQPYKTMQTVWYHYDVPKTPLGVSLLFMNTGLQTGVLGDATKAPTTKFQQMYGGYVMYHPKYVTLEGSYYRQGGKTVVGPNKFAAKIDAWMASAKATITPTDTYGFTLGYDYLSGDDFVPDTYGGKIGMVNHTVYKGFSPLYGSHNKFYGIMDYFYESAYLHGFTPGLQNAFGGVFGKPVAKLDLSATYHYLAVATKLHDLNRTLGHSIDVMASYSFTKDISLTAGYTLMFGTETMDRLKQGNDTKTARWGWFSLVVSPTLFTTKF